MLFIEIFNNFISEAIFHWIGTIFAFISPPWMVKCLNLAFDRTAFYLYVGGRVKLAIKLIGLFN